MLTCWWDALGWGDLMAWVLGCLFTGGVTRGPGRESWGPGHGPLRGCCTAGARSPACRGGHSRLSDLMHLPTEKHLLYSFSMSNSWWWIGGIPPYRWSSTSLGTGSSLMRICSDFCQCFNLKIKGFFFLLGRLLDWQKILSDCFFWNISSGMAMNHSLH